MYHEALIAGESMLVFIAAVSLLALSVWKRERLISEAAWGRLIARSRALRSIFALSFVSLVLYLFAESAELLSLESDALEGIYETVETIHMLVAAAAVLATIPLFSAMLGGEDAA